jgi:DNA-binding FrmR family transcriptional regulator
MNTENRAEDVCACCRHKNTPRGEKEQKKLQNRINRIIGQLGGIQNMIEDNRYCGDILIQIAAVESALQNLGYIVLQDHLETCVVEEIKKGNTEILSEAVDMIKKLK